MDIKDNVFVISEAEQVHCKNAAAISYLTIQNLLR